MCAPLRNTLTLWWKMLGSPFSPLRDNQSRQSRRWSRSSTSNHRLTATSQQGKSPDMSRARYHKNSPATTSSRPPFYIPPNQEFNINAFMDTPTASRSSFYLTPNQRRCNNDTSTNPSVRRSRSKRRGERRHRRRTPNQAEDTITIPSRAVLSSERLTRNFAAGLTSSTQSIPTENRCRQRVEPSIRESSNQVFTLYRYTPHTRLSIDDEGPYRSTIRAQATSSRDLARYEYHTPTNQDFARQVQQSTSRGQNRGTSSSSRYQPTSATQYEYPTHQDFARQVQLPTSRATSSRDVAQCEYPYPQERSTQVQQSTSRARNTSASSSSLHQPSTDPSQALTRYNHPAIRPTSTSHQQQTSPFRSTNLSFISHPQAPTTTIPDNPNSFGPLYHLFDRVFYPTDRSTIPEIKLNPA